MQSSEIDTLSSVRRNCNFSFSGLKATVYNRIYKQLEEHEVQPGEMVPEANNIAAR